MKQYSDAKKLSERVKLLKAMDTIIGALNDEQAYHDWIWVVPDQADDDDLLAIAEDRESFAEAGVMFVSLMKKYLGSGIYAFCNGILLLEDKALALEGAGQMVTLWQKEEDDE